MNQSQMQEQQSQKYPRFLRGKFDGGLPKMSIKTLTHDYYILQLPQDKSNQFYKYFPFYLDQHDYNGHQIKLASVARIYGTNQFGQKCCCHIHGYYSHFYIKCDEFSDAFTNDRQFLKHFLITLQGLYQRAYSVNKPIIMNGQAELKMDFYGYHEKPETFLKIIVYDPSYIVKLRQILDSRVLAGKIFQCYEAHINYFMQLFSDHNIYGINELNLIQFSFRKNLPAQIMDLFVKINTQSKKLLTEGFNLIQIQRLYPNLFNPLQKNSTCYIEIDIWMNSILNTFIPVNQIVESKDQVSIDSDMAIQNQNFPEYKTKFNVKITKALQQVWQDQILRRQKYGINQKPQGFLDYSKNIQGKLNMFTDKNEIMWINFIKKGNNLQLFTELIKSSIRGTTKPQTNELQICRQIAQNYGQVLLNQKEVLIQKVLARWKHYGSRKKNYIEQLMKGERDELPEWDDDKNQDSSSQISNQQQGEQVNQLNQTKSEKPKLKSVSNTILYRNNYKHLKATLKKNSYFYVCNYCKLVGSNCKCQQDKNVIQSTQESSSRSNSQQISVAESMQPENGCQNLRMKYQLTPPSYQEVLNDKQIVSQKPYYSNFKDLFLYHKINPLFEPCLKNAQILQRQLKLIKDYNRQPITIKNQLKLPYYYQIVKICDNETQQTMVEEKNYRLKYQVKPPTIDEVVKQTNEKLMQKQFGRRSTSTKNVIKDDIFVSDLVVFHYQFLSGFQANCQRYVADPEKDQVICFSYQIRNFLSYKKAIKGLIMNQKYVKKQTLQIWQYEDIYFVKNQYDLFSMIITIICRVDPDFLVTFDQQKRGVRYLTQRGFALGINFQALISRSCELDQIFQYLNFKQFVSVKQMFLTREILLTGNLLQLKMRDKKPRSQLAFLQQRLKRSLKKKPVLRHKFRFDLQIKGRVNISLYRICEQQLKLRSYTMESICKHLFGQQISSFTDRDLYRIYAGYDLNKDEKTIMNAKNKKISPQQGTNFVTSYIAKRLQLQAQIISNLNIITVLIEKSKIFGSDIVSMMQRGSQFKIQAIMCRVTKKLGYLTLSASKRQVGNQTPLQCVALVLEPPKQFFPDPVLLFDFQSLYPSIMIAYNLCFSTCLGSIHNLFDKDKVKRMGVSQKMNVDLQFLQQIYRKCTHQQFVKKVQNCIFLTPNKVAYVKKDVKEGIIPRILLQFLITRIMIKNSQGLYNKAKIKKILKDRQFALKLFMNVMFGYTGASFTGRMPCGQIADSIVELSKYCLRKSIDHLNAHEKYKGKVIYGDTDSIFFHMPGYSIKQTFEIGRQLALQITSMFPYPIQMKFQKVYDGLFLVAKKRYYGKMYQSQKSGPKYQGKGVQCVRRDGIVYTENLMRQMLNKLIDTRDLSIIKQIFREQSAKILNNQHLQSQFILAKEVKLLKYNQKNCPGHGQAAKRLQKFDPMLVPKYAQRMKYFVINGALKPVKSRSIPVFQYTLNKNMSLDLNYYFRKQVLPPIQRVISSLADLNQWCSSIQYRHKFQFSQPHQLQLNKKCLHCHEDTFFILCQKCFEFVDDELKKVQDINKQHVSICTQCTGCAYIAEANKCSEWDCQQHWNRRSMQRMKRNVYPQLIKLKEAIKQLNF